jgi:two-component system response regulator GlrR
MPKISPARATRRQQPAPPATRAPRVPVRPVTIAAPPATATILLVDDDPAVREGLARVLVAERWHVVTAASGEEALVRLADRQPDLLITDLRMAEVSGLDLLFHEYLQRPDMPVFIITALPPEETGGADRFAMEFFSKPLDLDALVSAIRRCLARGSRPRDRVRPPLPL